MKIDDEKSSTVIFNAYYRLLRVYSVAIVNKTGLIIYIIII